MTEYLQKYLPDVAHLDLSEDRKIELLRSVYMIMQNFVDRAFTIDTTQQALGYSPFLPLGQSDDHVDLNTITTPKDN